MDDTVCDYTGKFTSDLKTISCEADKDYIDSCDGDISKICKNKIFNNSRRMITSQVGWWKSLPVNIGSMSFVLGLNEIGYELNILTKGPFNKPFAWSEKVEWIENNFGNKYKLKYNMNIVSDKSLFYGKILFDDYVPYVKAWLRKRPRGFAFLPESPSNANFKHKNSMILKKDGSNLNECLDKAKEIFDSF